MKIGIDLGSRFVKLVYGKSLNKYKTKRYDTILFYKEFCMRVNDNFVLNIEALKKDLKIIADVKKIVSTGYGRNLLKFANTESISEIVAHFLGVKHFVNLDEFIVLDIGGQDTKIISVKNSMIEDFVMNDKCAAGSGRYLENMAKVLDIPTVEIGEFYEKPIRFSNTCAIFGESEIISQIVNGVPFEQIAAGVNYSIFSRLKSSLNKFHQNNLIFVGGMSENSALNYFIESELKKNVIVPEIKGFNGAFGCFLKSF